MAWLIFVPKDFRNFSRSLFEISGGEDDEEDDEDDEDDDEGDVVAAVFLRFLVFNNWVRSSMTRLCKSSRLILVKSLLLLSVCDDALRLRGDSSVRSNKVVCFFDIVSELLLSMRLVTAAVLLLPRVRLNF
jgi:hypothetical protein